MAQAANIVVKKNDGTTDVTFSVMAPASGDTTPAVFRNTAVGSAPGHQPEYRISAQWNGPKTARKIRETFVYPVVETINGSPVITNRLIKDVTYTIAQAAPQVDINEFISQSANLSVNSAVVKDSIKNGFAPT